MQFGVVERSIIVLSGRDRATLLHKFCTQDVLGKRPGQGGEVFICNVQGKIVAYVYFLIGAEEIILDTSAAQAQAIINHLDRYVITEDVQFRDASADVVELTVVGSDAAEKLTDLLGVTPSATMYDHVAASLESFSVTLCRVPFLGDHCWFVRVPINGLPTIRQRLFAAGAVEWNADEIDNARVVAGSPLYGRDITLENLPQEVCRDAQAINFKKGCYLGQETVARIDALGHVNKHLVLMRFPPGAAIQDGLELTRDNKTVGRVTSAAPAPSLALGYVRREHSAIGTELASMVGVAVVASAPQNFGA